MIIIEVRRSALGDQWIAEKQGQSVLCDPVGIEKTIPDAIQAFLKSFTILIGFTPEYKWIGEQTKTPTK